MIYSFSNTVINNTLPSAAHVNTVVMLLTYLFQSGVIYEALKKKNINRKLITADGGGSNGFRVKLWKTSLQKFVNGSKLEVTVCHFPPAQ